MSGPRVTPGVRVPLFDRLAADTAPDGRRDLRMLDRAGLAASIARELDRLLNTRTPLAADDLGRRPRSTLDYGLPDLSLFWPFDSDSEKRLCGLVTDTVAAFEPRLRNPRVTVERVDGQRRTLRATVVGEIALDGMVEPVSFPILLSDSASDSP
ncbi:type VI secretion system baseplate subunit TssE [Azospirillum sp. sgz301742]